MRKFYRIAELVYVSGRTETIEVEDKDYETELEAEEEIQRRTNHWYGRRSIYVILKCYQAIHNEESVK